MKSALLSMVFERASVPFKVEVFIVSLTASTSEGTERHET